MMSNERTRASGADSRRPGLGPETGVDQSHPELIGERDRQAFLDILSHELRTPVTTIYGGAQLLAKRDLKSDRRLALAEDVRTEADRLYRLVEDLVILVQSERDGIRPVGEPVAVGRLVSAAIEREVMRHPGVRIAFLGASDAAADGVEKLNRKFKALMGPERFQKSTVAELTSAQLSLAIGRPNVVHAAASEGGASLRMLQEAVRLRRYRAGESEGSGLSCH